MPEFELPSNVKQIGAIPDGMRIYMEDYVNTYLKQYSDSGGHSGKQAFLIGKHMIIDGTSHLFISGAVLGKYCENIDGFDIFTERSFAYAAEQIEDHFPGYEIVGEMRAQPGYGAAITQQAARAHMDSFVSRKQVLFLTDPIERVNCFYAWNDALDGLREIKGYFIYYEKNPGMQDYMLENKITRSISPTERRITDMSVSAKTDKPSLGKETREIKQERRPFSLFAGVSAALFVICFLMAVTLLQNDARIKKLEEGIIVLDSSYNYLLTQTVSKDVFSAADSTPTADSVATVETADVSDNKSVDIQAVIPTATPKINPTSTPVATTEPIATDKPDISTEQEPNSEQNTGQTNVNEQAQDDNTESVFPGTVVIVEPEDIPETPITSSTTIPKEYIVSAGDTLNSISVKFYGDRNMVDEIMSFNNISDPNTIFFGQVLKLPEKLN
jgi:LysM repeat protein